MIFSYNDIVKKIAKNKKINYKELYFYGLSKLKPKIIEFADTINDTFIDIILNHEDIYILLYCNDIKFKISNCCGFILYTKTNDKIYLLLLCISKKYRKFGYGKIFLEEFIEFIKKTHSKNKKIILHPIEKSIEFYKTFGFVQTNCEPNKFRKLFKYEKYDKNTCLFELNIS
jgi:GNAT superfamily N-acetyltransferase